MPSGIYAVLIADVVASSTRADVRALLGKKLAAASKRHLDQKLIRLPYSVTAGDEFQTVAGELPSLPALLLDLRSLLQPLSCVPRRIFQQHHQPDLWPARHARAEDHRKAVGGHRDDGRPDPDSVRVN